MTGARLRYALAGLVTVCLLNCNCSAVPADAVVSRLSWSRPILIDHERPYGATWSIEGISCASPSLCVAVDQMGNILTSTDPAAGSNAHWAIKRVAPGRKLDAISCPSPSLCVVVDGNEVLSSTDPALGTKAHWQRKRVAGPPEGFTGVACPTASLCIAVGIGEHGAIVSSTNPRLGRRAAWRRTRFRRSTTVSGVSCPNSSLCVAAGYEGDMLVSTDPGNPRESAWSFHHVQGESGEIEHVSCPSERLCVASDVFGDLVTSNDPASGPDSNWILHRIKHETSEAHSAISCASNSLCILLGYAGTVTTSLDATAGTGATWTLRRLLPTGATPFAGLTGLSCVPSLCVVARQDGTLMSSTDAGDPAAPWQADQVDGYTPLLQISCTPALCAATDVRGDVLTSTDPGAGPRATWTARHISEHGFAGISCVSSSLCVTVNGYDEVLITTDPADAAQAKWSAVNTGEMETLTDVSCASPSLCAATGLSGDVIVTTDAYDGTASHWTHTQLGGALEFLHSISCSSSGMCVVAGEEGRVITSTDPAAGAFSAWMAKQIEKPKYSAGELGAISCVTSVFCATIDRETEELFSTDDPLAGEHAAWQRKHVFGPPFAEPDHEEVSISCPSATFCVAADAHGRVAVSSDARKGRRARWSVREVDRPMLPKQASARGLETVSCGSTSLCVAVDAEGRVVVGTARTAPHPPRP